MRTAYPHARSVPVTKPQLRFLADLSRDRDVPAALAADLAAELPTLTKAGASGYITRLKACRYAPRTAPAAPVPAAPQDTAPDAPVPAPVAADVAVAAVADVAKGDVLIAGTTVIRVQQSRNTGNLYALTRPADAVAPAPDDPDAAPLPAFAYAPGLLRRLPADTRRLTTAEATAISAAWKECYRCGRPLTAAASVERGIGPVCITYTSG